MSETNPGIKISVYIDDGNVFEYNVLSTVSAREHADAIVETGYRRTTTGELTHFPPHRIQKVKITDPAINTAYPDTHRGT